MSRMDTWMPLFISDYLADTRALTTEEHGAYLLLLMDYWRHGPLLDDDKRLAIIAGVDRRSWNQLVGPAVRPYFTIGDDGRLHQKRLDIELAKAAALSQKRSIAATSRFAATTVRPGDRSLGARKIRSERLAEARKLGFHTKAEWTALVAFCGAQCLKCGLDEVTKDHIQALYAGGSDDIGNLQPLCGDCNRRKGADVVDYRPEGWREAVGLAVRKTSPSGPGDSNEINTPIDAIAPDLHPVCIPNHNAPIVPIWSAKTASLGNTKKEASPNQKNMLFPLPKPNEISAPIDAIAPDLHPVCTPFARVLHDSLSRDLVQEEREEGRKEENKISSLRSDSCIPPPKAAEPDGFVKWYQRYPRKVGRADACKAYGRALRTATEAEIYAGLANYPFEADARYQPMPATWLNKCRWQHEPETATLAPKMSMQAELERLTRRSN